MSTKKIHDALEELRNQCPFGPVGALYGAALDEVEAIANAARVIEAWQTGGRVLTRDEVTAAFNLLSSIAKESNT
jgi:hypothetical protein